MKRTPLRRKARLGARKPATARSGTPKPRKALPKVNAARRAREHLRAYGGEERVLWGKGHPCLICGAVPSENAHVPSRSGAGRKGDASHTIPLCHAHHQTGKDSLHALNKQGFEAAHHMDLDHEAAIFDARWEAYVAAQHKENA